MKDAIKVSVRTVVEWILRGGNIDARGGAYAAHDAMLQGARAHRDIQKEQKARFEDYKSEAWLSREFELDEFIISLGGRADGIFTDGRLVYIDEIKSTLTPLDFIDVEDRVRWGQAMCYAYMHAEQHELADIGVQITYCHLETGEIRVYKKSYAFGELELFMRDLIAKYAVWVKFERDWRVERNASIEGLKFPFESYRAGQRELAAAAYRAIIGGRRLFANAPTGIGKTISTIFPAIKAMPNSNLNKLFYLTAKNITRGAAYDAIYIMQERGLKFKTVAVTAKDKICPNAHDPARVCSPDYCEYALGHYDRANDAVLDALEHNHAITREIIESYALKHRVCPFEFSLDLSLFTDAVICDYNYAFDPRVYLRRFFQHNENKNYAFLIDEAHNLVDRARDMYSSELCKSQFAGLKKSLTGHKALRKAAAALDKYMLSLRRAAEGAEDGGPQREYKTRAAPEYDGGLADLLLAFTQECDIFLKETQGDVGARIARPQANVSADAGNQATDAQCAPLQDLRREVLQAYFDARFYQLISGLYDERYVTLVTCEGRDVRVKLFCLDPSYLIGEAMKRAKSAVIFSATLTPLEYFREILGGNLEPKDEGEPAVQSMSFASPFDRANLCLAVGASIDTRYKQRDKSYGQIADYISAVARRGGNYLVFFPSYEYMQNAFAVFCESYPGTPALIQTSAMRESERESFLANFAEHGKTLVGFCVLGGVFSEGIDLTGDRLNGAIIVGTGLPKLSAERDIIKKYFDGLNNMGYEYSYMYPGMNKVLQAAGRVIRTETDRGIVLLLDERFSYSYYKRLFPAHWSHFKIIRTPDQLGRLLEKF